MFENKYELNRKIDIAIKLIDSYIKDNFFKNNRDIIDYSEKVEYRSVYQRLMSGLKIFDPQSILVSGRQFKFFTEGFTIDYMNVVDSEKVIRYNMFIFEDDNKWIKEHQIVIKNASFANKKNINLHTVKKETLWDKMTDPDYDEGFWGFIKKPIDIFMNSPISSLFGDFDSLIDDRTFIAKMPRVLVYFIYYFFVIFVFSVLTGLRYFVNSNFDGNYFDLYTLIFLSILFIYAYINHIKSDEVYKNVNMDSKDFNEIFNVYTKDIIDPYKFINPKLMDILRNYALRENIAIEYKNLGNRGFIFIVFESKFCIAKKDSHKKYILDELKYHLRYAIKLKKALIYKREYM